MMDFVSGIHNGGENTLLSGSAQGFLSNVKVMAPITCLSGLICGGVIGGYLADKKNKTVIEQVLTEDWQRYYKVKDLTKENYYLNENEIKQFNKTFDPYDPNPYVSWWRYLTCQGPRYKIELNKDFIEKPNIDEIIKHKLKNGNINTYLDYNIIIKWITENLPENNNNINNQNQENPIDWDKLFKIIVKNESMRISFFKILLPQIQGKQQLPPDVLQFVIKILSDQKFLQKVLQDESLRPILYKIIVDNENMRLSFFEILLPKIKGPQPPKNVLDFVINILRDQSFLQQVLRDEELSFKIFSILIKQYEQQGGIELIIKLLQDDEGNPINEDDKGNKNNKGRTFLITFLKQYGHQLTFEDWMGIFNNFENMVSFLTELLKASLKGQYIEPDALWNIIFSIIETDQQQEEIQGDNHENNNGKKKEKTKKIPDNLMQLIVLHISKMGKEDIERLVETISKEKLLELLFVIFNELDKDKENKKYDENFYKQIFQKIVNESNIEIFIDIILENNNLKEKILANDKLIKLFLEHLIKRQDCIKLIVETINSDDSKEKNVKSKNELTDDEKTKKKNQLESYLVFFLSMWEKAVKDKTLATEDISEFLKEILQSVKRMKGQKQFDILWKILKQPILLSDDDKKKMPESFWDLLFSIVSKMRRDSISIPRYIREALLGLKIPSKASQSLLKSGNYGGRPMSYNPQGIDVEENYNKNVEPFNHDVPTINTKNIARPTTYEESYQNPYG